MDEYEFEELSDVITMARSPRNYRHLTNWEQHFVDDVADRMTTWGKDIKITEKMWGIIDRIHEKVNALD